MSWTENFKKILLSNKRKLNFVWIVTAITIGSAYHKRNGDILGSIILGRGGATFVLAAFGSIGGIVCGIRDAYDKRKKEKDI